MSEASPAAAAGTTMHAERKAATNDTMPGTSRIDPSKPNPPTKPVSSMARVGRAPDAASSPMAMGRSSPEPVFRTPLGARLTVMRLFGHGRWLESSAA
jgi:hypothetical protein